MTLNTLKVPRAPTTSRRPWTRTRPRASRAVANTISPSAGRRDRSRRRVATSGGDSPTRRPSSRTRQGQGRFTAKSAFPATVTTATVRRPGAPQGTTKAPPLAGSPRVLGHHDYVVSVLLHGLTGAVNDKTYSEVMVPMGRTTTSGSRPSARTSGTPWQPRLNGHGRRRRPGARRGRQAQDAVDGGRTGSHTPPRGRFLAVEAVGEPCGRRCACRIDHPRLELRRATGSRHVVPGRARAADDGR